MIGLYLEANFRHVIDIIAKNAMRLQEKVT